MHAGQGSLEYILLVSGAILVAIIVIAGALQTPQAPLGSSEYGLASAYCSATPLDGCFGKTVQSGPNKYACYLNDEGTQCQAQPLGSPGCDDGTCQVGENCPGDNVKCTTPAVCQRYPPNGVCISGCKYASLAEGEQVVDKCDDTHAPPGSLCEQGGGTLCECNGLGQCVKK